MVSAVYWGEAGRLRGWERIRCTAAIGSCGLLVSHRRTCFCLSLRPLVSAFGMQPCWNLSGDKADKKRINKSYQKLLISLAILAITGLGVARYIEWRSYHEKFVVGDSHDFGLYAVNSRWVRKLSWVLEPRPAPSKVTPPTVLPPIPRQPPPPHQPSRQSWVNSEGAAHKSPLDTTQHQG